MIKLTLKQALFFQKSEAKTGSFFNILEHKDHRGFFLLPVDYLGYNEGVTSSGSVVKSNTFKLKAVK